MISAVVYTSNSGYTKKYAELLSKQLNLPFYSLDDAKEIVKKGSEIVYLGWIMAGSIKGYKKANSRYKIKALCGVGIIPVTEAEHEKLRKKHKVKYGKFYYLRGGFSLSKLSGMYHAMMKGVIDKEIFRLERKDDLTDDERQYLRLIKHGGSLVSLESLEEVINDLKSV